MGFWRKIRRRRRHHSRQEQYSPYTQPGNFTRYLRDKIQSLKTKSKKWNDNDLKEIVDVIDFLNEIMLRLERSFHNLQADHEELKQSYKRISSQIQDITQTLQARALENELGESPENQLSDNSDEMIQDKAEIEKDIESIDQYIKNYQAVMKNLASSKKNAEKTLENHLRPGQLEIHNEFQRLSQSGFHDRDAIKKISQLIHSIPLWDAAVNLCMLADNDLKEIHGKENEILQNSIDEFRQFVSIKTIIPSPGDRLIESEHEIVGTEKDNHQMSGTIYQCKQNGYKHISGKILLKAKVIIWG